MYGDHPGAQFLRLSADMKMYTLSGLSGASPICSLTMAESPAMPLRMLTVPLKMKYL